MNIDDEFIHAAKALINSVEYDVNGHMGKGGHGGLTSNETIRAAGMLRILISRHENRRRHDDMDSQGD